jgi:hypothetical protein
MLVYPHVLSYPCAVWTVKLDTCRLLFKVSSPICCTGCMCCLVQVRGPVVVGQYHGVDTPTTDAQGWFDTGDVASLDTLGYMRITDRSKDVIKSGGEWISSITLENLAMGHPQVGVCLIMCMITNPRWADRTRRGHCRHAADEAQCDMLFLPRDGATCPSGHPGCGQHRQQGTSSECQDQQQQLGCFEVLQPMCKLVVC